MLIHQPCVLNLSVLNLTKVLYQQLFGKNTEMCCHKRFGASVFIRAVRTSTHTLKLTNRSLLLMVMFTRETHQHDSNGTPSQSPAIQLTFISPLIISVPYCSLYQMVGMLMAVVGGNVKFKENDCSVRKM